MSEIFYSIGKVAELLGVSVSAINLWEKEGKIECVWTPGHTRRFPESEVNRLLGKEIPAEHASKENACVIYARVSSGKQKEAGNLERQRERLVNYAVKHGYRIAEIFEETASGLNENRKKLHGMLRMAEAGEFSILLIEFKDRLSRFGFRYLEDYLSHLGVTIEVAEKRKVKQPQEELAEDLVTIITSFSARLYGMRSRKFKKVKEILNEKDGPDATDGQGDDQQP